MTKPFSSSKTVRLSLRAPFGVASRSHGLDRRLPVLGALSAGAPGDVVLNRSPGGIHGAAGQVPKRGQEHAASRPHVEGRVMTTVFGGKAGRQV